MPRFSRSRSLIIFTINLLLVAGLLGVPAAAGADSRTPAPKSRAASDSAGDVPAGVLKALERVAPPVDSAPKSEAAPPGDPEKILAARPVLPGTGDWKAGRELVEHRTANSRAFAGSEPGEIQTRIYSEPVNFRQGDRWSAVDTNLSPSKDGRYRNRANSFGLEFAGSADDPALAELNLDSSHSVGFGLEKAAKVKGKAQMNSVTYSKALKDTDLRLISTGLGVKEDIILQSPEAGDRFVFPLRLKGLTASIDELGDVVYRDSKGNERARTPAGYMFDSDVDPLSGEPAFSDGVTYRLIGEGSRVALEITLDREWLYSSDRKWPITVDPQIQRGAWTDDTYVMNPYTNDYSADTELKVGTFNGGTNKARSFMHFDTGSLPGAVTHAELEMREMHSYNCGVGPGPVYRVNQGWVGSTMRTFPGASFDPASQATGGWRAGGSCHNRTAWWIVTPTVQHWQNIGETMGSFVAAAFNEGDSNQWKKYRSTQAGGGPVLKIWTTAAPAVPSVVAPAHATNVAGPTMGLTARHNGPGSSMLAFGLWDLAGNLVWAQWSNLLAPGQTAAVTTSPLPEAWYDFRVAAYDGHAVSEFTAAGHLVFNDQHLPAKPSQLLPAGGTTVGTSFTASALYTEHWGWPGAIYFYVFNQANTELVTYGVSPAVQSGQTGSAALSLAPGNYNLYAYAYDVALSPLAGPNPFTVAGAPGAPSGVIAQPGPNSALVKWTPGSTGGSAITGYSLIAYNTASGTAVATKPCTTACSPSGGFVFDGLVPGSSYTFRVRATNAAGTGPLSGASQPITVRSTVDYADGIVATPGDTSVRLDWEAEFLATSYRIKAYKGSRPATGVADPSHLVAEQEVGAPATTLTITNLSNAGTYYFTVTPVVLLLLVGPPSAASNEVVPFGVPFAPRDVQALPSDGSAVVMWNPPAAQPDGTPGDNGSEITGYRVTVLAEGSAEPVTTVDVGAEPTFAMVNDLDNGSAYSFKVQAINAAGAGPGASTSGSLSPGGRPSVPENVAAELFPDRNVLVTWDPSHSNGSPITGYRVIVSPNCSTCGGTNVGNVAATTVTGLAAGTTYQFRVVARNAFGEGAISSPTQSVALAAEVPSAPTNVVAEWDSSSPIVRVSWAVPNSNGSPISSYRVTGQPGSIETTTVGTTAEFTNLDPAFAYSFVVRASNSIGEGPASATSAPVAEPDQVPIIELVQSQPGDRLATVSWLRDSSSDVAFGHVVTVYRVTEGVSELVNEINSGPDWSIKIDNLAAGEYIFAVRGWNAAGLGEPAQTTRHVTVWNREDVDRWMFDSSLDDYLQVRADNPYPYSFDSDGCSVPPQFESLTAYEDRFVEACKRHDFGYQNFGRRLEISQDEQTKNAVNQQFRGDMEMLCDANPDWNGCHLHARVFADLVDVFDDGFWNDEQWSWSSCPDNPEVTCE